MHLSRVLARAFYDDPVTMLDAARRPDPAEGADQGFAALARHHFLPRGGSEVGSRDGVVGAATLWDPPGQRKASRLRGARR